MFYNILHIVYLDHMACIIYDSRAELYTPYTLDLESKVKDNSVLLIFFFYFFFYFLLYISILF